MNMVERYERFSLDILAIARYWHRITANEMERCGLSGQQSTYLTVMYRYPEGIVASELCRICCKDKSEVSRSMTSMEKKGLVQRDNSDKRILKLTKSGEEMAERIRERARLAMDIVGTELSEEERDLFYSTLERIASRMRELSENGLPE